MTLRSRLLLVLVGMVAVGFILSDVATYAALRSFFEDRIDPQLQVAAYPVTRAVLSTNALASPVPFAPPQRTAGGEPAEPGTKAKAGSLQRTFVGFGHRPTVDPLVPGGTIGELVDSGGRVIGRVTPFTYGGREPPRPRLTAAEIQSAAQHRQYLTTTSGGSDPVTYRVLVESLGHAQPNVVVAVPLTSDLATLSRLRWIEVLVSVAVLGGMAVLAWWIVLRGLRPLDEMASTAGQIARGDLSRRVTPADDKTEVGRLGLSLNSMLGEIEEAFEARAASEGRLRRFLADASHELRTPLTSIRGYAEIFDMGASSRPADLATAMHHIRDEAERMNVLVNDLLLLARLDHERPLELRRTDLADTVERSVIGARAAHPDREVRFVRPDPVVIDCDDDRVRQVVDNLVSNAIRHSPTDRPVEVEVGPEHDGVVIEVGDHGPGVTPDVAARIFEPFYRSDRSRTRTTGGAGLGLAIVDTIARAHGGTVGVRPNRPRGARFWVWLPRSVGAVPPTGDRSSGKSPEDAVAPPTEAPPTGGRSSGAEPADRGAGRADAGVRRV